MEQDQKWTTSPTLPNVSRFGGLWGSRDNQAQYNRNRDSVGSRTQGMGMSNLWNTGVNSFSSEGDNRSFGPGVARHGHMPHSFDAAMMGTSDEHNFVRFVDRRHSIGDIYGHGCASGIAGFQQKGSVSGTGLAVLPGLFRGTEPMTGAGPPGVYSAMGQCPMMAPSSVGGTPGSAGRVRRGSSISGILDEKLAEYVNEYFLVDKHQRVKVTVPFLRDHFEEESMYMMQNSQLPSFPMESNLRNYELAFVAFKCGRIDFFIVPNTGEFENLQVGDLVLVEADRGKDLGKVAKLYVSVEEARLMKLLQILEQQAALNEIDSSAELSLKNFNINATSVSIPSLHFPKQIFALANRSDALQILNKKNEEEKACKLCLAKVASTIANSSGGEAHDDGNSAGVNNAGLELRNFKLIDAEYQLDHKKLIFYYSTHKRIDFRDLVRELFRIYKTRIWMCAVTGIPYTPRHGLTSSMSPILSDLKNISEYGDRFSSIHSILSIQNPNTSPLSAPGDGQYHGFMRGSASGSHGSVGSAGPIMESPSSWASFSGSGGMLLNQPGQPGQVPERNIWKGDVSSSGYYPEYGSYVNPFTRKSVGSLSGLDQYPALASLRDPFQSTLKRGLSILSADDRMDLSPNYEGAPPSSGSVPRKFYNEENKDVSTDNESFVLKSLVDSINH